ncbi:MAG: hypothetical protein DYG98_15715 [Haliscomenobacteraceae bacterium CHB4]|nr:hypothetical protein [Saprospiraceae bacterium]MCE7924493.1 hypothetical protein [Haliscomenobacteraceae bacterium CHB4]
MAKFDIEAYLDGELNPDERAAFEAEMDRDPEFAQKVRLMQQLTGDLKVQLLRDHVTRTIRDGSAGGGKKSTPFWLGGLALVLLFCAAGYFFLISDRTTPASGETPSPQTPPSHESPQQTPGGHPENPGENPILEPLKPKIPTDRPVAGIKRLPDPRYPAPNIRGGGPQDTVLATLLDQIWYMDFPPAGARFAPPFDEAGQLLQQRDFSKAYLRLELLERTKTDNDTLRFLKGYCLLEMGQGGQAVDYLEQTADDKPTWSEYRQWYRALGLLLSGDGDEAKKVLEMIRNAPKHHFQRQSAKALELLK